MDIAKYIDHTILKPDATKDDIVKVCNEARQYLFKSVCTSSCWVPLVRSLLKDTSVKVCSVVGFPHGNCSTVAKSEEARQAVLDGADEIDMVLNIGFFKTGMYDEVLNDIKAVRNAAKGKVLKVILETSYLNKDEIKKACELSVRAGCDYVKTSTGFSQSGAKVEDVALMRKTVGDKIGVKASGGIRDYKTAKAMIESGATRIGASAGIKIVEESKS